MTQSQVVLLAVDFFEMAVLEMGTFASSAWGKKGLTRRRATQKDRTVHPNYILSQNWVVGKLMRSSRINSNNM